MSRLFGWVGTRRNTSPANVASWLIAILVLAVAIPANDKIGSNAFFFVAHDLSPIVWIVELLAGLALAWLIVWLVLRTVHHHASARAFDMVASLLTFVLVWFFAGNALTLTLFPKTPWLGPIVGAVAALVITWLSRAFAMGTALLVVSAVAAAVPLFSTATAEQAPLVDKLAFASAEKPNVLWIVADELSYPLVYDESGTVREQFPNIAALQQNATTYTNAYAGANFTDYAVPGMLAGITDLSAVDQKQLQRVRANLGLIPGFSADYSVVVESPLYRFECNSRECAKATANTEASTAGKLWDFTKDVAAIGGNTVLAKPFVNVFPSLDGKWRDFWSGGDEFGEEAGVDTVGAVINGITDAKQRAPQLPFFAFWHTIRTHGPWTLDAEGEQIFPARVPITEGAHMVATRKNETVATDDLAAMSRRLYVNSAVEVDRQVGELVAALKEQGLYDDTMIVFTADHGVAVTKQRIRRVGDSDVQMWSEVAHVPLMVKNPGQSEPQTVTDVRSTGQIARTVLDETGATPPSDLDLSPALTEALGTPPVFSTVTTKGATGHPLPDLTPQSPWTPQDLSPDAANPFAIGIDPALIGQPVPDGAVRQPADLTVYDGVSNLQLLTAERQTPVCEATTGLVANEAGEVIGSVLWEGAKGSRGWAIVPRDPAGVYALWCAA